MSEHPTGSVPKKVVILATGPSRNDYLNILASATPDILETDEVWGVNTATNFARVDVTFMMDDYAAIKGHSPVHQKIYETAREPIITTVPRKECPTAIAYPLADVLIMNPNRDFLNHCVSYILAYAALIGVEEICIFGADYLAAAQPYGDSTVHWQLPSRFLGCASYWAGFCEARGMKVIATPNSPFLDADTIPEERLYGYLIKPVIRRDGDPVPQDAKSKLVVNSKE